VAIQITDPDCDTGKTCLRGGMHPGASSFLSDRNNPYPYKNLQ